MNWGVTVCVCFLIAFMISQGEISDLFEMFCLHLLDLAHFERLFILIN